MRKFSHSSMSMYRRCRARYQWSYIDNYVTKSGMGQYRGSAGHVALATWYGNEMNDELAYKAAAMKMNEAEQVLQIDVEQDWNLLYRILCRYFDWARANDNFTKILGLENMFEIKIGEIPVIGYIDGIVEMNNGIWLLENKFNKRVSLNHIDIDSQMSLYMLAALKMGVAARGVLFNVIRMTEGGIAEREPVVRTQVYRNPEGLRLIEAEVELQLKEMVDFHEKGGYVYRNPTGDCSWDCGFFQTCLSINDDGDVRSALSRIPIVPKEPSKDDQEEDV